MVDALRTKPKHCPFLAQGRKLVEGSGAGPYLEVDRTQFRGSNAALSPSVLDPEPTKTACSRQAKFRSATGCCRSLVVLWFGSAQEWVETPHARHQAARVRCTCRRLCRRSWTGHAERGVRLGRSSIRCNCTNRG